MTDRTILHTHVEGSTALRARLGTGAEEVLANNERLVREAVEEHGGRETTALADGFTASFVTARAAVDCAVTILRAFDVYAEEGLRIRAGVATGDVPAAARIVAAARIRQILVTEAVRDSAGTMPGVQFVDRGEFRLDDGAEPSRAYEVLWSVRRSRTASPIATDPEAAPFVGHETERDALRAALHAALAGRGSMVLIAGEPGAGKTRLAEDVAEEASRHGFLALTGHCHDLDPAPPFMPLLEILRTAMSVVPPEVMRESVGDSMAGIARLLPELAESPEDAAPPTEAELPALLDACRDFLERTCRRRPTLLVIDHLQWADAASLALLRHSADKLGELPAVIVGLYRPDGLEGRLLDAAIDDLLAQPAVRRLDLSS